MKTKYILFILCIGFFTQLSAQEKSKYEIQGDAYCFNYSYEKAIASYTKAKILTSDGQRKLAESYHNLEKNIHAEEVYSKLILSGNNVISQDYYNYASILKINRKYALYDIWMAKFYEVSPNDLRAIDFNKNKYQFAELSKDKAKYVITHMQINTTGVDFGTSYYKDKIVFATSRGGSSFFVRKDNWTGVPYSDLYIADIENGQLSNPQLFDSKFNSSLHDGPASFSNNGTFMAFTQNNAKDKTNDNIVELQLLYSNFDNGAWVKSEPFFFNNKNYSVGQPCLTEDGNTMYFVSDMPGGYGGADIYKVSRNSIEVWGQVQNLGPTINTEGDEMFPFIEETNQILYFSSNGRFGLGGLDIFSSAIQGVSYGEVQNLGYPLNTEFDDFALIVNATNQNGYFTSNRPGGKGNDDLYAVTFTKPVEVNTQISGNAMDEHKSAIPNVFITLYNVSGSVLDTLTTKGFEAYTFTIKTNTEYRIVGKKQFYLEGDTIFNTLGAEQNIHADVILFKEIPKEKPIVVRKETPKEIVAEKIKVGVDLAKVLEFNPGNIYFDYGKSNIRPDAIIELNKIVEVMNDHPSMVIELGAYTDCRSSDEFNQILSEKRAKSTVDYIRKRITNPTRITGKGFGETKPVVLCNCDDSTKSSDCSQEQHQQNRRSEFIIIKE